MHAWEDSLEEIDKKVIELGGYGKPRGLGEKPVLMIVDAQYNYVGGKALILQQIKEYPSGVGEQAWAGVKKIRIVLDSARKHGIPVIFTRYVGRKGIAWLESKTSRDHSKYDIDAPGSRIVEEIAPRQGELILDKSYASVFFGTPLISYLVNLGADTLIITGGTTSGCVRATAVDAASYGYKVAVVEDCVFDRIPISHKASLLDLWMKYADIISSDEALKYFDTLKAK